MTENTMTQNILIHASHTDTSTSQSRDHVIMSELEIAISHGTHAHVALLSTPHPLSLLSMILRGNKLSWRTWSPPLPFPFLKFDWFLEFLSIACVRFRIFLFFSFFFSFSLFSLFFRSILSILLFCVVRVYRRSLFPLIRFRYACLRSF